MRICWIEPARWIESACSVFLLSLIAFHSTAQAANTERVDVFAQLIEMRRGATLFHEKRYSDAEQVFEKIYLDLQQTDSADLERISTVLNFLAQSKSFTGKNNEALVLLRERLNTDEKIYGIDAPATAPSRVGLAEAYYRIDQSEKALELTRQAIIGLESLGDEHAQHLTLAQNNLKRYTKKFDASNLPHDLRTMSLQWVPRCRAFWNSMLISSPKGFGERCLRLLQAGAMVKPAPDRITDESFYLDLKSRYVTTFVLLIRNRVKWLVPTIHWSSLQKINVDVQMFGRIVRVIIN